MKNYTAAATTTSHNKAPLLLLVAFIGAFWFLLVFKAPNINVQSSTPVSTYSFDVTSWDPEMSEVFGGNHSDSTKHEESPLVLNGAYAATDDGKILRNKGDGRSNGSVRMFAGINGQFASVAILHIVSTQMNFLVLKGNVSNAGFCAVAASCLDLGNGLFMNTGAATWVAAWTMSQTLGKDTDPSQFLTVSQGWEAWAYYQSKYNLYTEVFQITLP